MKEDKKSSLINLLLQEILNDLEAGNIPRDQIQAKEELIRMTLEEIDAEDCPTCNGEKEVMISCCTQEVIHDDLDFCPECKEHMGLEECPDCKGIGMIIPGTDQEDFHETATGMNEAAIRLADEQQERGY